MLYKVDKKININQEFREVYGTLRLAQQVAPDCNENNSGVNICLQESSDPLVWVALYQFPPAKEIILELHQLQQKSVYCIAEFAICRIICKASEAFEIMIYPHILVFKIIKNCVFSRID